MYYNGCNAETTASDLPAYIQPYGQLKVSSFSSCLNIHQKWWSSILVTTHCDDKIFDLEIVGYPFLESFTINSASTSSSFFQYSSLFRLEGIITFLYIIQISHLSNSSILPPIVVSNIQAKLFSRVVFLSIIHGRSSCL